MAPESRIIQPIHIGIIMDGNRRWAKRRGLPTVAGHEQGVEVVRNLMDWLDQEGIKYCTLYTFSSENWRRDMKEVKYLMRLLVKAFARHLKEFHQNNIKLLISGRTDELSEEVQRAITKAMRMTAHNTKAVLNLALNYGGRHEVLDAVKQIITNNIPLNKIDEEMITKHLYTKGEMPEPDLIIRTGGEQRLSNFLPWQSVYSELYFTDVLWPDFSYEELQKALKDFADRKRNFGK